VVAVARIVPTSRVDIRLHGTTPVSEPQIRAALDGGPDGRARAYSALTVHVCTQSQRSHCLNMGRGEVGVVLANGSSYTDISTSMFSVPLGGEDAGHHNGSRHPDAQCMVGHAVDSARKAGQEAGQVSAAVHAAIEAQGLNFARSLVWWGWAVAAGLLLACILGLRHRRLVKRRQALQEKLATASRQLSTVLLQLETTELSALQLTGARAERGSASISEEGSRQVALLRRRQGQLLPRTLTLLKKQRDLASQLPRGLPTAPDASGKDVEKFANGCASLLQAGTTVTRGATLLSASAGAVDVWDAEATPLIRSGALIEATLDRTGYLDQPGVSKALADLEDVKAKVLAAGAARAERMPGRPAASDSPAPCGAPSSAQVATGDLDVLVEQTMRVDGVVQRMIRGALRPRVFRLDEQDLPRTYGAACLSSRASACVRGPLGRIARSWPTAFNPTSAAARPP
jgi:hypothetical protein